MLGNGAADIYAVRCTGVAEQASPPLGKKPYREASRFYRFLLPVSGNWVNDANPFEDWIPKVAVEPVRPDGEQFPLHPTNPHTIEPRWGDVTGLVCKCFCRKSSTAKAHRKFYRGKCMGTSKLGRLLNMPLRTKTPFVPKPPAIPVAKVPEVAVAEENFNGPSV